MEGWTDKVICIGHFAPIIFFDISFTKVASIESFFFHISYSQRLNLHFELQCDDTRLRIIIIVREARANNNIIHAHIIIYTAYHEMLP